MNKFVLFLSLISIFGFSQNNFKESSIVFKDGGIKKGFVNYVKTRNTPQIFKYKSSIESEAIVLDSTQIKSVEISDIAKFIFRKNIEVSFESKDLVGTNGNKVKFIDKFVEVLVDGEYSLCNYSDNQFEEFYYFGSDSKLKRLKTKMFYGEEGKLMVAEEYKTELIANLANGNPEIIKKIKYTRLKSSDLSDLFYLINKKDLAVLKAKNKDGFLNINLSSDISFISSKGVINYSNKTIVGIGGEIEYMLPYYNNLFALELVPSFNVYKNEGIYNGTPIYQHGDIQDGTAVYYPDPNNGKKVITKSTVLSIPLNLKIYPINKKIKVYASLTMFNLLYLNKGKINFENEPSFETDYALPVFKGFFEIGGSYKNFGLSFKQLRKQEDSNQYIDGYAVSLKYNIYTSKK